MHYYSWDGCIQRSPLDDEQNTLDPLHLALRSYAPLFEREAANNDGIVGRYSSHLGKVIRSDYSLDHLATVNQTTDTLRKDIDPVQLYVEHAALLFRKGL